MDAWWGRKYNTKYLIIIPFYSSYQQIQPKFHPHCGKWQENFNGRAISLDIIGLLMWTNFTFDMEVNDLS
jgi:hypothetical protein